MSIRIANLKLDGFQSITSGVDSGRSPSVLDRTQLAWAVNVTTRDGFITCRPGYDSVPLTFLGADSTVDATVQTAFETGLFQGASSYLADDGLSYLVALIGGRVFLIDVQTRNVQDLSTLSGLTNQNNAPQAWFCQAENYLIIQNSSDANTGDGALIYDGATLRRSAYPTVQEVPPGNVTCYNNGRLWVTSPDGYSFVAGDLVYSVTGTRADVLGFTENTFLNGGGAFSIPSTAGPISAMRSIAVQDNATGAQGPMIVFTTRGAFGVEAPFNRDEWQNTRSPIVTITLLAAGAVGQEHTVNVNGDIWFRAPDGIRSFIYAQRDHGTWVNTPLSREVSRALDTDSSALLSRGSTILFNNRLLCTTQPYQVLVDGSLRGIAHKGLVPLDFSPVSRMFNRSQPNWEGVWTGLPILQALTTSGLSEEAYLFALDSDDKICLWQMSKSARFDDGDGRIQWSFETPAYGFDTEGWNLREVRFADFWATQLWGQVDLTFKFRPDNYPIWLSWSTARFCTLTETCDLTACTTPSNISERYAPRVRLPAPSASCLSPASILSNPAYRFAVRVEAEGYCSLPQFRMLAVDIPEDAEGGCPSTECSSEALTGCNENDYTYEIN